MKSTNDTIAAIATPVGEGGIGIVRMSGDKALAIADSIFRPSRGGKPSGNPTHTVHFGCISSRTGEVADEVLITVMRAPRSYTAEDVIEISCHGGTVSLKKVLDLCIAEGARLAEPGEFTKRAFLNGRIDLSQAEAVLDIIKAETDRSQKAALGQLRGELSERVRALRAALIDILSSIELTIDFSQEDVEFPEVDGVLSRLGAVRQELADIIDTSGKGMVLRQGASVVICGRPNVGKSSLMNALLKHDRVIVTPVAGTTRDVIEESIDLAGVRVRISDTAGIIETTDRVEVEGIKRSKEKLEQADAVIFMLDSSLPLSEKDGEIYDAIGDKPGVIAVNKSDLDRKMDIGRAKELFGGEVLEVSALKKQGLDQLEDAVARLLFGGDAGLPEGTLITNLRHKEALDRALRSVERGAGSVSGEFRGELLASDLNEAVRQLGLITGETAEDDVLDRIFAEFCIGK